MWAPGHSTSYITHTATHRMQGRCTPTWRKQKKNRHKYAHWLMPTKCSNRNHKKGFQWFHVLCCECFVPFTTKVNEGEGSLGRHAVTGRPSNLQPWQELKIKVDSASHTTFHGVFIEVSWSNEHSCALHTTQETYQSQHPAGLSMEVCTCG